MCTILLRVAPGSTEPVQLAANRDEFRTRPADEPGALAPGVFGGRDRLAGGTWLAVGPAGLAAVTNIGGVPPRPDAPSRGRLPLAALAGTLPDDLRPWNAFNLLVVDAGGARVVSHDGRGTVVGPVALAPGTHVLTNELFGVESLRTRHAAARLVGRAPDLALLADHGPPPAVGLCHHGETYGTVSATLVALDARLGVTRYLHVPGLPCTTPAVDLSAAARSVTNGAGA